jgi:2-polyprenyl-3-methyl-5-hydroxy-6-metoxy-1,4-benzoquinol methylase
MEEPMTTETAAEPTAEAAPQPTAQVAEDVHSASAIERGRPSYSWRFGQDRRLEMVRQYVPLEGARILDVGCGIGTYVRRFRAFSDDVHGVDVEEDRVAEASLELPNIQVAAGEALPYEDGYFDVVFSNEVIEHVADDRQTIREAVRVTRPGGSIVIFAPNRLYPFETHGAYFGSRYVFGNIPLIGWLPDPLRERFAPHVRAYTRRGIRSLFRGQPVRLVHHGIIYPGFDNLTSRHATLGPLLRRALYAAEHTRSQAFGLSHFLVVRKVDLRGGGDSDEG